MKKSKLSIGLVASFIAAMSMTSCGSDVTANDKSLVTFKPYNGTEVSVLTDAMFNRYGTTSSGITKYYEQILEVLIRYDYKVTEGKDYNDRSLAKIEEEAANDVENQRTKAKENADNNKTSYETEWQAILDTNGVENDEELKQLFIFNKEKEALQDWYFKNHEDQLKLEYLGINTDGTTVNPTAGYGKLTSKFPYHIRHILVKNEDGANDYQTGTIDSAKSKMLYNVVDEIASGNETFGRIAQRDSEDTSGEKFGDVGIMNNAASETGSLAMVPEFQLGIYAYDVLKHQSSTTANTVVEAGLGMADDDTFKKNSSSAEVKIKDFLVSAEFTGQNSSINGLVEVPFNVFKDLNDYADITADIEGHKVLDTDKESVVYPRNIIWNKYLNRHNPFIITNRSRTAIEDFVVGDVPASKSVDNGNNELDIGYDTSVNTFAIGSGKCGFKKASDLGFSGVDANMSILTDENDNIIIGVRSQYGIHFTVIQKSMYDFNSDTNLVDYYTTKNPLVKDSGYPTGKNTYVNYIKTDDKATYDARAKEVESAIKSFDTTYDYRLYESLVAKYQDALTFKKVDGVYVNTLIANYINIQREKIAENQKLGMNKAWTDYLTKITVQNAARSNSLRTVSEGCVIGFKKNLNSSEASAVANLYKKGGTCYYGK